MPLDAPYWRSCTLCTDLTTIAFEKIILKAIEDNPELARQADNMITFRKVGGSEYASLEFRVLERSLDKRGSRAEFKLHIDSDIEVTTKSCSDSLHKFIVSLLTKVKLT